MNSKFSKAIKFVEVFLAIIVATSLNACTQAEIVNVLETSVQIAKIEQVGSHVKYIGTAFLNGGLTPVIGWISAPAGNGTYTMSGGIVSSDTVLNLRQSIANMPKPPAMSPAGVVTNSYAMAVKFAQLPPGMQAAIVMRIMAEVGVKFGANALTTIIVAPGDILGGINPQVPQ